MIERLDPLAGDRAGEDGVDADAGVAVQGGAGRQIGGGENDGVAIGLGYLWRKWFNRKDLPVFLDELTKTDVLELPPVGPS